MTIDAEHNGRSELHYVPDDWLVQYEAAARNQVYALRQGGCDTPNGRTERRWSGLAPFVVSIVLWCVISLVWAVATGMTFALWLAGGSWLLATVALSIWAALRSDDLIDAAARW